MRLEKLFAIGFSISLLASAVTARADSNAVTPSDENPSDMSITFKPDELKLRNSALDIKAGGFMNGAKQNGVSLKMRANKRFVHGDKGEGEYGNDVPAQVLDLGVEGRIDINRMTGQVDRLDVRGPEFTAIGARKVGRFDRYDSDKPGKPYSTSEIRFISVSPIFRGNRGIQTQEYGAAGTLLAGSLHTAFKFQGIPMDICGQARAVEGILGKVDNAGKKSSASIRLVDADVCLGVQLGPIGRLRNTAHADLTLTDGQYYTVSDTVSVDKILGSPVGLSYTYEVTGSNNNAEEEADRKKYGERKHMVNAQLTF